MKGILSSEWRLSWYALMMFIGGTIASLIFNLGPFSILGSLTGSLLIVIGNVIYVIYKKKNGTKNEEHNTG
ncbi:hypothetical protein GCM10010954_21530 [Halobacillus andaensis]|uniref:Uncharacterized protein n=1 Tax=Halobacillus andaensis TaxID=1176239 RepID=A0A917B532_HALAA|nr:hypothetical protein [Halobacillus andaensis]MBP2004339.1 prolipoprotein diacylglyceryltransferase [Halobacillus andaensis]GGF22418.1 hypothetical protein GCM10010954_21530 [Halobacillus andaensis]